jgi:7,8-dihydropterin-6-yl-methyl-4-(beta-D-ribofuranosyl)aminobenzene 5'-phosphate synthase
VAPKGIKITIVVDNRALDKSTTGKSKRAKLASEHGLTLWIETEKTRVLFDTGQGPALQKNVPALGVELADTDVLVLSHGHYDHTGGLPQALREASHAHLYCHPGACRTRYSVRESKVESIGIRKRPREALRRLPSERLHWVIGPVMLTDRIGMTGPVPRLTDYEDTGGPFYEDMAGWRPDPLEDDQALWISTDKGLVVCFGCAHSGAVNTLEYIRTLNPGTSIHAVLGGFHLLRADQRRMQMTTEALRKLDIPLVVPCHCTGADAFSVLAATLGSTVSAGGPGVTFEF